MFDICTHVLEVFLFIVILLMPIFIGMKLAAIHNSFLLGVIGISVFYGVIICRVKKVEK